MGIANNVRGMVQDQEDSEESKKRLTRDFNTGALKLMNGFLNKVESGQFTVDTVKDYKDLYNMFLELNNVNFGDDASGGIPALSVNQALSLEQHVEVKSKNVTDERGKVSEEKYIDVDDLDKLNVDDINDTLAGLGEAINKDNLEAYNE